MEHPRTIGSIPVRLIALTLASALAVSIGAQPMRQTEREARNIDDLSARMAAERSRLASESSLSGQNDVETADRIARNIKAAQTSAAAKPLATCATQQLTIPANVSGTLSSASCIDTVIGSHEDIYGFTATAGQNITITMSSTAFSVFLYMSGTTATITSFLSSDGVSAERIVYTIPSTGSYKVEAESLYSPTSSQPSTGPYVLSITTGGTPPTDYPNHSCGIYPITCGTSQSARLTFGSCVLSGGSFADYYSFSGSAGDTVSVSLVVASSTYTKPFVAILPPQGDSTNPPSATGSSSATISNFKLTSTGTWAIGVSTLDIFALGNYTVSLSCTKSTCLAPIVQSSPQNVTIASGGSTLLSVSAQGSSPLHYSWHEVSDPLSTIGADSSQFQTPALSKTTQYYVAVSNSCGSSNSAVATITVSPTKRRAVRH